MKALLLLNKLVKMAIWHGGGDVRDAIYQKMKHLSCTPAGAAKRLIQDLRLDCRHILAVTLVAKSELENVLIPAILSVTLGRVRPVRIWVRCRFAFVANTKSRDGARKQTTIPAGAAAKRAAKLCHAESMSAIDYVMKDFAALARSE